MRISITDRCDLRCRYCMPPEGIEKISMDRILTYEEILRICRAAAELGIRAFKVTGGEPLVRKGCPDLIRRMKAIPGVEQVTLTTNGQQLERFLGELADAGTDGINISLDSLRQDRFREVTGGGDLTLTQRAIYLAAKSGIPTKVNCLLQKDFNEDELEDFAALAFSLGIPVRFIEIMPVGFGRPDTGLSNETVLSRLKQCYPGLTPDASPKGNGPAVYYSLPGRPGAIGLISAMHHRFCGDCNRVRLTARGELKPCLCFEESTDLLPLLRPDGKQPAEGGAGRRQDGTGQKTPVDHAAGRSQECGGPEAPASSEDPLEKALEQAIYHKPAGHCFVEEPDRVEAKAMAAIGG